MGTIDPLRNSKGVSRAEVEQIWHQARLARDVNRRIMSILGPALKLQSVLVFAFLSLMLCSGLFDSIRSFGRSFKAFTFQDPPPVQVPAIDDKPQLPDRASGQLPPYQSPYDRTPTER